MGGPGMQPPQQQRGQGTMGILMPIYTIGIVIFFLYTVMKVGKNNLFKWRYKIMYHSKNNITSDSN